MSQLEDMYWNEIWPETLLPTLYEFMVNADVNGLLGLCSLSVCHQQNVDCEAAITSLLQEVLNGLEEAKEIRKELKERRLKLKEMGVYDVKEKRADLLEKGFVSYPHLKHVIVGYKRKAREIYASLNSAGFLKVEKHRLGNSGEPTDWIGFDNVIWDDIIEDIETTGNSTNMFASSFAVMMCMAINRTGTTTVMRMARGAIIANNNNGEIDYNRLNNIYHNPKGLNNIMQRDRERMDELRLFSSNDGRKLVISPNLIYAIGRWQTNANSLAQNRGLGV